MINISQFINVVSKKMKKNKKALSLKMLSVKKRIKVANPKMFIWLLVPIFALVHVTQYFFEKPKTQVLGASTEEAYIASNTSDPYKRIDNFKYNGLGVASIIFTGARKNQYDLAYPEVESRGLLAGVSVPVNEVGFIDSMTWLNIKLLQFKGWEIISQSRDQICDKEKLKDGNILKNETSGSKEDFTRLGIPVNLYLAPCGITTSIINKRVQENYKGIVKFGIESNLVSVNNFYSLTIRQVNNTVKIADVQSWIKDARVNRKWLIISFPNIDVAQDNNNVTAELLKTTLDELKKSNLQIALPVEILKYDKR